MCSVGAVTAALSRGNRMESSSSEDYQVVLPQLPTGPCVLNTVFLHGDIRARPYRAEDFRDTLARQGLLTEVVALGAFQMNHVWAVTFSSAEAVKKVLCQGDLKVKDRRCLVVDPWSQDVRLKLYWLLRNIHDEEVCSALSPYGKVKEVTRERWRIQGIQDKGSSTRTVCLKLQPGVTVDDLPHQLRIGGIMSLLVAPGRAPLCLRCNRTGHIRRDCRVPRCVVCKRFGHEESECVRTYANVAGPPKGDEVTREHLMDEADAEEAASGSMMAPQATTPEPVVHAADKETPKLPPKMAKVDTDEKTDRSSERDLKTTTDETSMDTSGAPLKRTLEEDPQGSVGDTSTKEPMPKTPYRRMTLRPQPNLPASRKPTDTAPT
ncbi:uncharacterized protein LOC119400615 [Rhipicephalus sanguineus]|uniref:uncharacterized protein LOC119400615 n=1 Tax=Rhipicephalus sanguineus TaxID=34632 RepID=UPI001892E71B|nr:uncharacterized protein LOC119400615 [Rhipicephalus sanguineus]